MSTSTSPGLPGQTGSKVGLTVPPHPPRRPSRGPRPYALTPPALGGETVESSRDGHIPHRPVADTGMSPDTWSYTSLEGPPSDGDRKWWSRFRELSTFYNYQHKGRRSCPTVCSFSSDQLKTKIKILFTIVIGPGTEGIGVSLRYSLVTTLGVKRLLLYLRLFPLLNGSRRRFVYVLLFTQ